MVTQTPEEAAVAWWRTSIIDIRPGHIQMRGYPIEELIGRITFPDMIWLMLRGGLPTARQSRLLEAALVASVDHGPQAPGIAIARMAITCGIGINSAMASGINALGDVHGGAGQQCMEFYARIVARVESGAAPQEAAKAEVEQCLREGKSIPGFGHRFHPVDPRAGRLLALVDTAAAEGAVSGRYAAIGR